MQPVRTQSAAVSGYCIALKVRAGASLSCDPNFSEGDRGCLHRRLLAVGRSDRRDPFFKGLRFAPASDVATIADRCVARIDLGQSGGLRDRSGIFLHAGMHSRLRRKSSSDIRNVGGPRETDASDPNAPERRNGGQSSDLWNLSTLRPSKIRPSAASASICGQSTVSPTPLRNVPRMTTR